MKNLVRSLSVIPLLTVIYISCTVSIVHGQPKKSTDHRNNFHMDFRAEPAPEWTGLFHRDSGWIGGDGLFSIPMNGVDTLGAGAHTETLIVFSDSFWGNKKDGKVTPGGQMTNNVVARVPKTPFGKAEIQFYSTWNSDDQRAAVFIPNTPHAEPGNYYWLGDGFINRERDNTLYIFAYRMKNTGAGVFGFKECGNALIAVDANEQPPFKQHRQLETPLFIPPSEGREGYSFGAGILVNTVWAGARHPDGYVYVYGVRGTAKELLVSRVLPKDFEDFGQWQYWTGNGWGSDIRDAEALTSGVSNELSMIPLSDGRFILTFQKNGIAPTIGLRVALSPTGPFGPLECVFECPEPLRKKSLFAYNAKAHPHLSRKGELLISYHVNSFEFLKDFNEEPDVFAPRFIRLIFE